MQSIVGMAHSFENGNAEQLMALSALVTVRVVGFARAALLIGVYSIALFIELPRLDWRIVTWRPSIVSTLFVWAYLSWVGNRRWIPLMLVFVLTLAFPLLFLVFIGMPVYHSWQALAEAFFATWWDGGIATTVALVLPTLMAFAIAHVIALRKRS